ncbi:hypothetical protein JTE90_014654 [Oedothorax gibbosus]|uniref:Uncharacterized protein n=1 Tax=Oedothorax gibbosus TaxID=931172 RepID=A0AAV6V9U5_9ARAC|nr:hypothetical protein JTE90_014654 [Oedothorax gibbosus]
MHDEIHPKPPIPIPTQISNRNPTEKQHPIPKKHEKDAQEQNKSVKEREESSNTAHRRALRSGLLRRQLVIPFEELSTFGENYLYISLNKDNPRERRIPTSNYPVPNVTPGPSDRQTNVRVSTRPRHVHASHIRALPPLFEAVLSIIRHPPDSTECHPGLPLSSSIHPSKEEGPPNPQLGDFYPPLATSIKIHPSNPNPGETLKLARDRIERQEEMLGRDKRRQEIQNE